MANISHFTQTVNGVSTTYDIHDANAVPRSGGSVMTGTRISKTTNDGEFNIDGGRGYTSGATLWLTGKDHAGHGSFSLVAHNGISGTKLNGSYDGTLTWGSKNVAMQEDVIPRSGGQVMNGNIHATANTNYFSVGHGWGSGGTIYFYNSNTSERRGGITIQPYLVTTPSDINNTMNILPGGTWTWNGTACQITSDQRFKQQITQIDDKLLDAWQDVEPCQFKYNDAVDAKKDKARLHTGYVVQQIDKACQSHGVDISTYGLYCHEEYPQETEEVEVEQADGTKVKETKVIREASEHYSLRYTEALIVECAYLRKCIKELRSEIEQLKSSK